jgi:hypothetical protein
VNNAVHIIEQHECLIPESEDEPRFLGGQMRSYIVKKRGVDGRPIYEGFDHILDAFCIALYGFHKQFTTLARRKPDTTILQTDAIRTKYLDKGAAANRWNDPTEATKASEVPVGTFAPERQGAFKKLTGGFGPHNYTRDSRAKYMDESDRAARDGVDGTRQIGFSKRANPIRRAFRGAGSRRRSF